MLLAGLGVFVGASGLGAGQSDSVAGSQAARESADDVAIVTAALAAGPSRLSPEAHTRIYASMGIDLSSLADLSVDAAAAIANDAADPSRNHARGVIDLSGLRALSAPVAAQLARYPGRLRLDGIKELSPEAAAVLAEKVGEHGCISLAGLETLSPEAARAVGGCRNILSRNFPRLATLSPEAARALIDGIQRNPRRLGGAVLDLSGVTSLSPELAAELANNRGVVITLGGLHDLSPEAAQALVGYRGNLLIRCPGGRMTPEVLGLMMEAGLKNGVVTRPGEGWKGIKFHVLGLETLTPEDVANLAKANPFNPWLGGIARLEPETAQAIVALMPRNAIYFPDLVDVPPEFAGASLANKELRVGYDAEKPKQFVQTAETLTAEIAMLVVRLAESGNAMALEGITAIESPDAAHLAAILATSKAGLSLPNLRRISPKTLTALLAKEDVQIPSLDAIELIEEPDGGAADDIIVPDGFHARQLVPEGDQAR